MTFLRRHRVFVVLFALGVVLTILVAHRVRKQQAAAVPRRQIEVVVGVARPVQKDLEVKLAYTADVLPNRQVAIFSKVSGYIRRLGADLGDFVKEGQLLVEIEAPELSGAVEQARAASNGVLLVEYINERRRHGESLYEAVPRAGRIRLRPILMTVLTTVVGLLPMALAFGVGTEANQPLAIAVIGGLLVSTFFTLILIPTLYVTFEEWFPRRLGEGEEHAG